MACLALSASCVGSGAVQSGLEFLARMQLADGGVPAAEIPDAPCWTTSLTLLAWELADDGDGHKRQRDRAAAWLMQNAGIPVDNDPPLLGHDTSLIGWSWSPATHSWVEPTAYAVMALRAAGRGGHPRVREGLRLLLDRAIPSGGWNYGNPVVIGTELTPFPAATGVALTALAGEERGEQIERAIAYLGRVVPKLKTPMSLGWALIGLTTWNERPEGIDEQVCEAIRLTMNKPANGLHDALLLLASLDACPFARGRLAVGHAG